MSVPGPIFVRSPVPPMGPGRLRNSLVATTMVLSAPREMAPAQELEPKALYSAPKLLKAPEPFRVRGSRPTWVSNNKDKVAPLLTTLPVLVDTHVGLEP